MSAAQKIEAREKVILAVLRVLSSEHYSNIRPHAHSDAEAEHADDELVLAARALVAAEDGA